MNFWDFVLITSPIWLTVSVVFGLREICSSKYDEQWYTLTKKFSDWWYK